MTLIHSQYVDLTNIFINNTGNFVQSCEYFPFPFVPLFHPRRLLSARTGLSHPRPRGHRSTQTLVPKHTLRRIPLILGWRKVS